MKERPRRLEATLERSLREFPVTTVIGLRQSGKTTLVRRAAAHRTYVTLDDLGALAAARRDPEGFLGGLPRPLTIDEVQRVPELLLAVKREVDRRPGPGRFLLTGSAHIELRKGVSETLAGRAALLRMRPMTWAEAAGRADWNPVDALLGCRSAAETAARFARGAPFDGSRILGGGLPVPLLRRAGAARTRWFEQYRSAYVERDVPPLVQVDEVSAFVRFLTLAAARTSQTTNFAALAHESGLSADTGLRWFSVLESTFLADLVPPYWRNIGKRLVKAPKLHFGDAGLAAHMMGISDWRSAQRQHVAGALLETLVAQHLLTFAETSRRPTQLFHYRTHAGAEVDFVLSRGARLLPVEVKLSSTVKSSDVRGMAAFLDDFSSAAPFGVVLTTGSEAMPVARGITAIPLMSLLEGPGTSSN
jgi:hypothetical protein